MALDELPGCLDSVPELVELAFKVSGLYTVLLGVAGLCYGVVDAALHDKWALAIVAVTALGLAAGWVTDLLSRLIFQPLLRLAHLDTDLLAIRLLAGAPVACAAVVLFVIFG